MATLRAEIMERKRLMDSKDLAEGEKNEAHAKLKEKEEELRRAQQQQLELEQKLNELNSKVSWIVFTCYPESFEPQHRQQYFSLISLSL